MNMFEPVVGERLRQVESPASAFRSAAGKQGTYLLLVELIAG